MITEDIIIPADGLWVEVGMTSSMISLYNKGPNSILMRLGSASTSDGFLVNVGAMIIVDETCYVRSQKVSPYSTHIVVTR